MGVPTPSETAARAAVKARLDALVTAVTLPAGTVIFDHLPPLEDPSEFLELEAQRTDKTMDAFFLGIVSDEEEGDADDEQYPIYRATIFYQSIRLVKEWSKLAKVESEKVKTDLNKNASIFAIGGQRQVRTPVIVREIAADYIDVGGHRVFEVQLELDIEARRFS